MVRLIIVPTSHIASQSIADVKAAIEKHKPDCVAVELDYPRYLALSSRAKSDSKQLRKLGLSAYIIFTILSALQKSLSKSTGIFPGTEMVTAVDISIKNKIDVVFIDRPIAATFRDIQTLPSKEKLKLIVYAITGSVAVKLPVKKGSIDLSKVPPKKFIAQAIEQLKGQFPTLYDILLTKRDRHMARALRQLLSKYGTVVAVMGAAHAKGVKRLLEAR